MKKFFTLASLVCLGLASCLISGCGGKDNINPARYYIESNNSLPVTSSSQAELALCPYLTVVEASRLDAPQSPSYRRLYQANTTSYKQMADNLPTTGTYQVQAQMMVNDKAFKTYRGQLKDGVLSLKQ